MTSTQIPLVPLAAILEAAKPIAELVDAFGGRDEDMIAVEAGELRQLLAAIRAAETRLRDLGRPGP